MAPNRNGAVVFPTVGDDLVFGFDFVDMDVVGIGFEDEGAAPAKLSDTVATVA